MSLADIGDDTSRITFLHEENRALWEGRSKYLHNREAALRRIYGVSSDGSGVGCYAAMLIGTAVCALYVGGFLFGARDQLDAANDAHVVFAGCGIVVLAGLLTLVVSFIQQINTEEAIHFDEKSTGRKMADIVRYGTYIVGRVEQISDATRITFSYLDADENPQQATYNSHADQLPALTTGDYIALIKYDGDFVML